MASFKVITAACCLLLVFWAGRAAAVESADAALPPPAHAADFQPYLQERLDYDISFLWFNRLARGELRFRAGKVPGTYEAELDAATLGVASWLTGNRRQHYRSSMELMPDGRLRTLFQESQIIKGDGAKRREKGKRYVFDYAARKVRVLRLDGSVARETASFDMAENDQPNDFLTCFFNFRAGRFGAIRPGTDYLVPSFSRKGEAKIQIRILTAEERHAVHGFPDDGLLARVQLDSEVLDTDGGSVYVWFDPAGRPARAVVENVLGLGNVRGDLRPLP